MLYNSIYMIFKTGETIVIKSRSVISKGQVFRQRTESKVHVASSKMRLTPCGKRNFADVFNLRTLRQEYYPGLYPGGSFVTVMRRCRRSHKDRHRKSYRKRTNVTIKDWGGMTASQGNFQTLLETLRGKEKEGIFPSSLYEEKALSIPHFHKTHFEILVSRRVNEYICVDLSHYFLVVCFNCNRILMQNMRELANK